ncbi:MAG: polyamine aminopropyltransferase [Sandaracinaceae bacterium]|nr:polyamine aminopropyltransferase [Sandaracinaceae bacterium]
MTERWIHEVHRGDASFGLRVTSFVHAEVSPHQRIEIVETAALGRVLVLDGVFQTAERDERAYHELLAHPALCAARSIARVLVIGGGDGGTAREVLRHPEVERCVMVEIDRAVVEACRAHLPSIGGSAWSDPRLEVRFEDGARFVRECRERFDVVILDGSDPIGPSAGLFGRALYEDVRRLVGDDGLFALQTESPAIDLALFLEMQGALRASFERVHPYFGAVYLYAAGLFSWTVASGVTDPRAPRPARVAAIEAGCAHYDAEVHRAAFAAPPFVRRRLAR